MTDGPADLHFRIRDNGAVVLRRVTDGRARRTTLEPVAAVNLARGTIKPQGGRSLTEAEHAAVQTWIEERQALEAARRLDDVFRLADQMGRTAQWAQTRAGEAELEAVTDELLIAMQDLRGVLVRKRALRMKKDEP